jgi:hypothetical protein
MTRTFLGAAIVALLAGCAQGPTPPKSDESPLVAGVVISPGRVALAGPEAGIVGYQVAPDIAAQLDAIEPRRRNKVFAMTKQDARTVRQEAVNLDSWVVANSAIQLPDGTIVWGRLGPNSAQASPGIRR